MAEPQQSSSLLDDVVDLGERLAGSEIPPSSKLGQFVGAIVKMLDHAGTTVPDELKEPEPEAAPSPTPAPTSPAPSEGTGPSPATEPVAATSPADQETESRLSKLEDSIGALLSKLEGKSEPSAEPETSPPPAGAVD